MTLKGVIELAWTERYFKVLGKNHHPNNPKIGTLHATVLQAVEAAFQVSE